MITLPMGSLTTCNFQSSCHLRDRADQDDIAGIVRGAIQCVLSNYQTQNDASPERKLLSDAFVASYAVHETLLRLGTPITYNPPAISKDERTKAEDMFLRLTVDSEMSDDDLIAQAKSNLGELYNLAQCGFLRRLAHNACRLHSCDRELSVVFAFDRSRLREVAARRQCSRVANINGCPAWRSSEVLIVFVGACPPATALHATRSQASSISSKSDHLPITPYWKRADEHDKHRLSRDSQGFRMFFQILYVRRA